LGFPHRLPKEKEKACKMVGADRTRGRCWLEMIPTGQESCPKRTFRLLRPREDCMSEEGTTAPASSRKRDRRVGSFLAGATHQKGLVLVVKNGGSRVVQNPETPRKNRPRGGGKPSFEITCAVYGSQRRGVLRKKLTMEG